MIRIAIQAKGRLNEDSTKLLEEAGIRIPESRRQLLAEAENFPLEVLYLRDDDIPQAVAGGVADSDNFDVYSVAEKGARLNGDSCPAERLMQTTDHIRPKKT